MWTLASIINLLNFGVNNQNGLIEKRDRRARIKLPGYDGQGSNSLNNSIGQVAQRDTEDMSSGEKQRSNEATPY